MQIDTKKKTPKEVTAKDVKASGVVPEYTFNPLTKARNMPCPCDSGLKAKRCCGQIPYVPADLARRLDVLVKRHKK